MKKLKGLIIQNRIKYLKGISIMFVIGVLVNLLFKHHPFSLSGFFPIVVIFCYGVYKDFKSLERLKVVRWHQALLFVYIKQICINLIINKKIK